MQFEMDTSLAEPAKSRAICNGEGSQKITPFYVDLATSVFFNTRIERVTSLEAGRSSREIASMSRGEQQLARRRVLRSGPTAPWLALACGEI